MCRIGVIVNRIRKPAGHLSALSVAEAEGCTSLLVELRLNTSFRGKMLLRSKVALITFVLTAK